ncbi:hypothetical protein BBJ28_00021049 [Nothophytophthora sp. Chile5]|nr:hypothetical protein BBJ28_00021049 [Nothophytophthora sp. Chile5]
MPALSSRSYVHLLPEFIGGSREYPPVYAKVTKVEGDAVQLSGLHDAADAAWTISRANALAGLVSAREVGSAREGSLLRRAVALMVNDHFSHGQVVAVKDQSVTVRLGSEEVVMRASQVSEVAPVVALLFQEVVFDATEWSRPELNAAQGEVLDRILGTDEHVGFRDIPSILEGIVDGAVHPNSDSIVSWMDPRTGSACEFPLQQAIDYAYFVDGNVQPIPASVGPSFCRSSVRSDRSTPAGNHTPQLCNSMFNHQLDDDEGGIAEQGASASPHELAPPASSSGKRTRWVAADDAQQLSTKRLAHAAATDDRQQDESIAAMLLDRPDLLQRFLSIRSGSSQHQASDMIHQRHDCQDDDGASRVNWSSKYVFAPTPAQRRVHA